MNDQPQDPRAAMLAFIRTAQQTEAAAKENAEIMASMLEGNLRRVPGYKLAQLKKELRAFNAHTCTWRELQ